MMMRLSNDEKDSKRDSSLKRKFPFAGSERERDLKREEKKNEVLLPLPVGPRRRSPTGTLHTRDTMERIRKASAGFHVKPRSAAVFERD